MILNGEKIKNPHKNVDLVTNFANPARNLANREEKTVVFDRCLQVAK